MERCLVDRHEPIVMGTTRKSCAKHSAAISTPLLGQCRPCQQELNLLPKVCGVSRICEQPGVAVVNQFRNTTDPGANHRLTHRVRFQNNCRLVLIPCGRHNRERRSSDVITQLLTRRHKGEPLHVAYPPRDLFFQPRRQRAITNQYELAVQAANGFQEDLHSLVFVNSPEVQHVFTGNFGLCLFGKVYEDREVYEAFAWNPPLYELFEHETAGNEEFGYAIP